MLGVSSFTTTRSGNTRFRSRQSNPSFREHSSGKMSRTNEGRQNTARAGSSAGSGFQEDWRRRGHQSTQPGQTQPHVQQQQVLTWRHQQNQQPVQHRWGQQNEPWQHKPVAYEQHQGGATASAARQQPHTTNRTAPTQWRNDSSGCRQQILRPTATEPSAGFQKVRPRTCHQIPQQYPTLPQLRQEQGFARFHPQSTQQTAHNRQHQQTEPQRYQSRVVPHQQQEGGAAVPTEFPAITPPAATLQQQQKRHGVYSHANGAKSTGQKHFASHANLKEYAVQLVPNLPSIQLVNGSPAAFKGLGPPSHHLFTPVHAFLQDICQDSGANFADAWLDTAHITFASLLLPANRVQDFVALLQAAACSLPDLSTGCYKIVDLQHFDKPNRHDVAIKGSNFYFLDLESTTPGFLNTQFIWLDALKRIAQQLAGKCELVRSIGDHHMTVRSFSLRNATKSFRRIRQQVQANPATMRCAGIRIQQSVDQALKAEPGSDQGLIAHGYFYKPQARYPVCLYSSCMQASHHVRLHDEQMRQTQKATTVPVAASDGAAMEAAVEKVLEQLSLSMGD